MLLLAALAASGQAGPRDGSGSDEAAGLNLRHWLSGLTISWPDTTVVVTSPERDPRGGHPLYVTISGAVCSKSHIEAVRSEFLDGHLSSEAEASSELYVAVDHFGVECEVSRVLVEQAPPARSGSMLVPLQLGEKLCDSLKKWAVARGNGRRELGKLLRRLSCLRAEQYAASRIIAEPREMHTLQESKTHRHGL